MASFRKHSNGSWEYRIRYKDKNSNKYKEKSKRGFKTKKEAQLAAAQIETDIEYYGFANDGKESISEYFSKWLEIYKKPNVKPITYSLQERNVRLNILPQWGNLKLKDITRTEYQKWINELRDEYSEGTVRRIHSIMNTALNDAVHEFRILRENPVTRIKIPKETKNNKEIKFFTVDQLEKFLNQVKEPQKNSKYKHSIQYYVLFSLMARTGLRIGEALALTWDDIDFEERTIKVNKTLVYPTNSTPYLSTPKTKAGLRIIKLDAHTTQLLKKHRINRHEVVLKYKNYKKPETNIVFYQHDGRWLRTNVVREYFKEICKRADLPILSPHALRHSHAVHLIEAKADLKFVSERLGHSSIKITADTYLHVTKKIENDALEMYLRYTNL
ncbi:site-specific integrase [Bacillus subtilis]|uniref:site-specific integrase n=1 Tax=Bacillus subtilis TaxID=1423 RepID=UPI000FFE2317|nr:site-specific integrase [Bacillus subtilis]MCX4078209.1 site-specific integrase [Bacillus subtilis]QAT47285.1 site-specific integrase [Bacillus subtilis]